jgi:hypothetical protein
VAQLATGSADASPRLGDDPGVAAAPRRPARRSVDVSPLWFAVGASALIAALAVPGALTVRRGGGGPFDLDAELTLPALASAALLLCAAGAAAAACASDPARRRLPWAGLAALFFAMAIDEAAGVHEALEDSAAIDWQTLYVPAVAVAAWLWALGLIRMAARERLPFAAAALAWGAAQVLEAIEWTGPRAAERAVDGYGILMGVEELLEMTGSALFALALLLAVGRWSASGAALAARRRDA